MNNNSETFCVEATKNQPTKRHPISKFFRPDPWRAKRRRCCGRSATPPPSRGPCGERLPSFARTHLERREGRVWEVNDFNDFFPFFPFCFFLVFPFVFVPVMFLVCCWFVVIRCLLFVPVLGFLVVDVCFVVVIILLFLFLPALLCVGCAIVVFVVEVVCQVVSPVVLSLKSFEKKPFENHGKTLENHGKTLENPGKTLSLSKIHGNCQKMMENPMKIMENQQTKVDHPEPEVLGGVAFQFFDYLNLF